MIERKDLLEVAGISVVEVSEVEVLEAEVHRAEVSEAVLETEVLKAEVHSSTEKRSFRCADRESNPGHNVGNVVLYHSTTGAEY